jgi:DNA helicase II / ATP-dependent DNA helicase PcrA
LSAPAPAPVELGRGVIVDAGQEPPAAWEAAPRVEVGEGDLGDPAGAVAELAARWATREPVVVSLAIDPARFRDPPALAEPPFSLDPGLELPGERLHHLVWANNYDARSGEPVWWWARKAERLGAEPGGEADAVLPGVGAAWIDGGPRHSAPAVAPAVVHAESIEAGEAVAIAALEPGTTAEAAAGLAADQLAAVTHAGGPVRVIAPAGSGKTRVLTERFRHLLGERGYGREETIAVAYNKEAQRELEARLFRLQPRTRTLNSLGLWVLGEHRGRRPPLLEEPEVRRLVDEVFPIPRRRLANTDPVGPYLDALTLVRLGLRQPAEVESSRDDVPGLAEGFDAYRAALAGRGAVDFDEQIYGALEALLRDGPFRRRMQARHRHLLVDEFQDLTPAHVLLVRLLAMPAGDVFAVGDDDQTIYDHAGADPRFLVDFGRFFPGAGETALQTNYRCAERIVATARTLLELNRVRVPKRIDAAEGADTEPAAMRIETHPGDRAAETAVEAIREWRAEGAADEEIALLARVNSLLLAPQIALWSAGVPVRTRLRPELLERTGIAAALAWIRLAVDPDGLIPADLEAVRRRPSRGFPNWISKWLVNCRSLEDLRTVAERIDDARVSGRVGEMADDIAALAESAAAGASSAELLVAIRDRIGLGGAMQMLDGSKGTEAAASHLDDLEGLIQVASLHPDAATFEPWLRASLAESAGSEGVTLSTVHRVKGREWDRVVVYGVSEGLLPHRLSEDWEGERRVLHVAITRARRRCLVLGDEERRSPMIAELRGEAERAAVAPAPARISRPGRQAPSARGPARDADPAASEAERALREWRTARSREDRVPAYVVLSNRQLEGIAAAMPSDPVALLACDGIGPTKLERYGEQILEVLDAVRG